MFSNSCLPLRSAFCERQFTHTLNNRVSNVESEIRRGEGREPESEAPAAQPDGGRGSTWPLVALLVLAAATLLTLQMRRPKSSFDPLVGQPLPPLDAAGWLNSDRPLTADDLRGKIVVIDFWASWCGPCALSLPDLVKFHERYRDQGVMLVGLTDEPGTDLDKIQRFVHRVEGVRLADRVRRVAGLPGDGHRGPADVRAVRSHGRVGVVGRDGR